MTVTCCNCVAVAPDELEEAVDGHPALLLLLAADTEAAPFAAVVAQEVMPAERVTTEEGEEPTCASFLSVLPAKPPTPVAAVVEVVDLYAFGGVGPLTAVASAEATTAVDAKPLEPTVAGADFVAPGAAGVLALLSVIERTGELGTKSSFSEAEEFEAKIDAATPPPSAAPTAPVAVVVAPAGNFLCATARL